MWFRLLIFYQTTAENISIRRKMVLNRALNKKKTMINLKKIEISHSLNSKQLLMETIFLLLGRKNTRISSKKKYQTQWIDRKRIPEGKKYWTTLKREQSWEMFAISLEIER